MIRKEIISKMKTDVPCKLPQFVRNWFIFFGVIVCLVVFSAVADEAPDTEKKDDEVAKQTEKKPAAPVKPTENTKKDTDSDAAKAEPTKEVIIGDSDEMDRDMKTGITILIGNVKTVRLNEQGVEIGFLNADKVTLKSNPNTGETIEIIAVGNVEIRDLEIFATCDHATMNNLTNIIVLKDNVVVLQKKDRLETKLFTFNRTTGKQTGVGDVKFKVTVTQAAPTATPEESEETGSDSKDASETSDKTDENGDSPETEKKSDSDKSDAGEKTKPSETEKEEKDAESKSEEDKESEPTESEETEPTESEGEGDEEETPEETE
jgi:lipopolysaccharide export system protein LptA